MVRALIGCVFLMAACGNRTSDDRASHAKLPLSLNQAQTPISIRGRSIPPGDGPLLRRQRALMGTMFEIAMLTSDPDHANRAADEALDEVARLEDLLSEWQSTSEISQVNARAGQAPVHVSADTFRVVSIANEISAWSDGASDLSWAALHDLYTFQQGERRVPDRRAIEALLPLVNWRDIVLDANASTIFLRRPRMAIGTGTIAKGYALDHASAILQSRGIENFMIFGGGQVQAHGTRGGRPWRVGIQHPRARDFIASLELTDGSISTSGDYEHAFTAEDGTRWHHIIDPRTGLPVPHTMSVTIRAAEGTLADGIDTACFVLGAQRCLAMIERIGKPVDAVIIDSHFRLHATPSTLKNLVFRTPLDAEGRIPH